jgi:hypothetical protein
LSTDFLFMSLVGALAAHLAVPHVPGRRRRPLG